MDMLRITVQWTGFPGAPGYSNFFFSADPGFWDGGILNPDAEVAAESARDRVIDAFDACRVWFPSGIQLETSGEVALIDSGSGETVTSLDIDTRSVDGYAQGDSDFAGPVGAVVNWRTNDFRFGRRIRGRTFLVPIATSSFEDDGTLTSSARDAFRDFGSTMIGSGGPALGVWSRPRDGGGGVFATVTNSTVPDLAAVLRSRRD